MLLVPLTKRGVAINIICGILIGLGIIVLLFALTALVDNAGRWMDKFFGGGWSGTI
ncbi:MAG: hypothetical protein AAB527_01260 [Patescibacteria group bacterium]